MKVDTHTNILMSYAYMAKQGGLMEYLEEQITKQRMNLMIDCGAFTKHNSKQDMSYINVQDYCKFLHKYKHLAEKYVMLDVIGHTDESMKNYRYMLNEGLNPMYVRTLYDNNWDMICEAVERQPDICVAGGAERTKGDWIIKRYQDVYFKTNGKARVHGLGFFTFPRMLQCHLASIDASTWLTAPASFGQGIYFDGRETYRIAWMNVRTNKRKLPIPVINLLKQYDITPDVYFNPDNHSKVRNIESFMSLVCNIRLQKYCKKRGLDYFFACGSKENVQDILYVSSHLNTITWDEYLDYKLSKRANND